MDTRFLESLLAVVEAGSIAGAARVQGLTAAAVSQRIRVLETELDCTLLNRAAHSADPTAECLRLLPAAQLLVRNAERLRSQIDATGLSGPFRLGAVSTALLDFVPDVIRAFRNKAPRAELSVRPGTSIELYEALLAEDLDAAITVKPPFELPKALECRSLIDQPIAHIFPGPERTSVIDRESLPWIVYDRSSWGGRQIWERFGARIAGGHILCELDALEMIVMMVAQESGQAIIPVWHGGEEQLLQQQVGMNAVVGKLTRKMVFLQKRTSPAVALSTLALASLQPVANSNSA